MAGNVSIVGKQAKDSSLDRSRCILLKSDINRHHEDGESCDDLIQINCLMEHQNIRYECIDDDNVAYQANEAAWSFLISKSL